MIISAFILDSVEKGEPLSLAPSQNGVGIVCVEAFSGSHYIGVASQNVINNVIDLMRPPLNNLNEVMIGGKTSVIKSGQVVLPKHLFFSGHLDIGSYFHPKIGGWKTTTKQKKKSVGYILSIDKDFIQAILL